MTHVLLHYTTNWQPILDITRPILEEYCSRHGYELHIKEVEPYEKYNGLVKLEMIQEYLKEGDIGLVMDADAVITGFNYRFEDFISEEKTLAIAEGLNAGVLIVRKTSGSHKLIDLIQAMIQKGEAHCEQDAIEMLMKEKEVQETVEVLPHPSINNFIPELYGHISNPEEITHEKGKWLLGDFVCHLPSLSMETRIEKLKELKEKIVR